MRNLQCAVRVIKVFRKGMVLMSQADKLEEDFLGLSGKERAEVLDFVEFLKERKRQDVEESSAWSHLSVSVAVEEDDETTYTIDDLKEIWK
jgi:hypothetical protein